MNPELLMITLGGLGLTAVYLIAEGIIRVWDKIKRRRRQKAKPWRRSEEAPKLPVAHQQKTRASLGKSPVRKSRARIGTHHKTNR